MILYVLSPYEIDCFHFQIESLKNPPTKKDILKLDPLGLFLLQHTVRYIKIHIQSNFQIDLHVLKFLFGDVDHGKEEPKTGS